MTSLQLQHPVAWEAPNSPLRRQSKIQLYDNQQLQHDKGTSTSPPPPAPRGAGGLSEAPAAPATAAACAATATATATPTAGSLYRFRRGGAHKRKGSTNSSTSGDNDAAPPLLFSKPAGQVYVMLAPIVGVERAKPHAQVLLAAPIVVLDRTDSKKKKSRASGGKGSAATGGGDVLFRPHPTKRVVVKRIDLSWVRALQAEEPHGGPLGELKALSLLARSPEHPHVMPVLDSFVDEGSDSAFLVMPYADGGELFALAAESGTGLREAEARKYLTQVVAGLLHLKSHGMAHGDVSLENIMLVKEPQATTSHGHGGPSYSCRLIDFGLARRTPEPAGTPLEGRLLGGKGAYVSPELVDGSVRDWHAADVWALGVCLYNLCTGLTLYSHPSDPAFRILATEGARGARRLLRHHVENNAVYLNPAAAHLIAAMLHPDPARRPTLEDVLEHPWVRGEEEWGCLEGPVAF